MYAVIRTGGKQYRVAEGDVLAVEKIDGEKGQSLTFEDVLLVGKDGGELAVGTPRVENASVKATIIAQERKKKVIVFKFRRRKNYKKLRGHRQPVTRVRIDGIALA